MKEKLKKILTSQFFQKYKWGVLFIILGLFFFLYSFEITYVIPTSKLSEITIDSTYTNNSINLINKHINVSDGAIITHPIQVIDSGEYKDLFYRVTADSLIGSIIITLNTNSGNIERVRFLYNISITYQNEYKRDTLVVVKPIHIYETK